MSNATSRRQVVARELEGLDLGDPRRARRALEIAERFAAEPEASLPAAMLDRAMLEGLYRHLSSDAVTFAALLEPHIVKTAARAGGVGDILAVHDTTVCKFGGEARRSGLGAVNLSDQGFLAHVTLAVVADGSRLPLGVVSAELLVRGERKNTRRRSAAVRMREEGKESARWARGIRAAASRVADPSKLIHVADREGDIYELLAELRASGTRFIIRSAQNRVVDVGDLRSHLRDVSREAPTRYTVDVPLSRRSKVKWLRYPHAPRDARKAVLSVATASVELRRPQWNAKSQPEAVPVHLVHVFELGPPPGEAPVEWLLLTSEPIHTREEVERVIENYRARWTIEEYFKAVKTGCAYEARQLESFRTLSNLLAYTLVVAYALLLMRSLTRLERKIPATELLSATEMQVLRLATKRPLSKHPDVREAMLAIAALGGHLPSNGQPGWRILSRGWQRLRDYEAGFRMARTCDR
jgi:hypothetical protein